VKTVLGHLPNAQARLNRLLTGGTVAAKSMYSNAPAGEYTMRAVVTVSVRRPGTHFFYAVQTVSVGAYARVPVRKTVCSGRMRRDTSAAAT
jgi:hypothetical protein